MLQYFLFVILFTQYMLFIAGFDYYVFAYSWTPEFCYGHTLDYPGCKKPKSFWGQYFIIHGLWPQNNDGSYPASCTSEIFDTTIPNEIGWETMTTYWPDVKYAESDPNYDSFWEHEWSKHGTCSGLSQYNYFNTTIFLAETFGTPSDYISDIGSSMQAEEMRNLFGGAKYVALQCTSGKYIIGAYTCWSNSKNYPGQQIVCGDSIIKEDTCTENEIFITSF